MSGRGLQAPPRIGHVKTGSSDLPICFIFFHISRAEVILPPFGTRFAACRAGSARPLAIGMAWGRGLGGCGAMVWGLHPLLSPPFDGPAPIPALAPLAAYLSESRGSAGAATPGGSPLDPLMFFRVRSPASRTGQWRPARGRKEPQPPTWGPRPQACGRGGGGGRRRRTGTAFIPGGLGGGHLGRAPLECSHLESTTREQDSPSSGRGADATAALLIAGAAAAAQDRLSRMSLQSEMPR